MRLIRYEVTSPSGNTMGMLSALSFFTGSQFKDEQKACNKIAALTKPFNEKLFAPKLNLFHEYRFFFTNRGARQFRRQLKAVANQAKTDGWKPVKRIINIKDALLPETVYRDEYQIAISLSRYNQTPKVETTTAI